MFWTHKINISSQDETRALTPVYKNIDAQIYKQNIRLTNLISENTLKEITVILISWNNLNIKEWNIVNYTDEFWANKELKISWMEFIPAISFNKLIELKCDLI